MNASITTKRELLEGLVIAAGYTLDQWGNYVRDVHYTNRKTGERMGRKMRVVFNELSVRIEVQGADRDPLTRVYPWLRLTSCYYNHIVDCEDGRMRVGSMFVGTRKAVHA